MKRVSLKAFIFLAAFFPPNDLGQNGPIQTAGKNYKVTQEPSEGSLQRVESLRIDGLSIVARVKIL